MRNFSFTDRIFDTAIDTEKLYVPMNFNFLPRKDSIDKHGKCQIYLHVTSAGKRLRIPLDVRVEPRFWDKKRGRIQKKCVKSEDNNLILDNIEKKITEIKTHYRLNEMPLTLEKFKLEFHSKATRMDFVAFMNTALQESKSMMNPNTYKAENSILKKLKEFRPEVSFSEIDHSFLMKYKTFLMVDKENKETTVNKNLAIIKKYLNIAYRRGIKLALHPQDISIGSTDGNRTNLDGEEVDRLAEYFCSRFIKPTHKKTLAMFLLACFNGLRISDAQQLTPGKIDKGKIVFTSVKTKKVQILQINLTTEMILEACPEILTEKYTDQYHNRILKEICTLVGINKNVTFHVARHTFATNYLRLGGKVEVLQKILGHSKITQTMVYVHIVQQELDRGMEIMDNLISETHFAQLYHSIAGSDELSQAV